MTSPPVPADPGAGRAATGRAALAARLRGLGRGRAIALAALAAAVIAWLAALALASGTPDAVRAKGGRIAVTMEDFRFSVERIRTRRGPFRMEVRNEGTLPHALVLLRVPTEGEAGRVITRRPGESGVLEVEKLNRGSYRYICPLSHHEELGMHGTIVVR